MLLANFNRKEHAASRGFLAAARLVWYWNNRLYRNRTGKLPCAKIAVNNNAIWQHKSSPALIKWSDDNPTHPTHPTHHPSVMSACYTGGWWISQKTVEVKPYTAMTPSLWFLRSKFHPEILTGFICAGRQTRVGRENKLFSSFMRQYLENGTR